MPRLRLSVAAAAVASALASGAATAQFSNLYFFGDSLSDAGQYKPVLPPGTGLFTTNPGPIWVQDIGSRYGLVIVPSTQGGTSWAYGGARVTLLPGYPAQPPTAAAVPIATQVQSEVARGIDPNATYLLWGGANDIFNAFSQLSAGQITQAQAQAAVTTAATQFGQQVGVLQSAGARYVVVLNLPDIGKTPAFLGTANASAATQITGLYNTTLQTTLDTVGGNQVRVNIQALFNEVIANPAAYGFANVSTPACGATSSLVCTSANFVTPSAAQTFLFADGVHPTTAGHAIVAQLVASMLEGPMQIGLLAEAPLAVEQAQFRTLDGRMWSALGTPAPAGRLQSWVAYDYGNTDLDGGSFSSGNSDQNSVALGLDMRVTPNVLAGLAFGYTEDKVDFSGGGGGFKLRETSLTAYGGWGSGPWYLGGSLLLANLDYDDVRRQITLGPTTRTESGETNGSHWAIRLLGGYWFTYSNLVHGPFAKVVYQEAEVDTFTENSGSSTALRYERQKRESLITSLGWQAQGQWGMVRPFARATWEWEAKDDLRYVTASSATLGGSYSVPSYQPADNWGLFLLGASMDFGKVTGYISGTATAGKNDGEAYGITVGVRVPL